MSAAEQAATKILALSGVLNFAVFFFGVYTLLFNAAYSARLYVSLYILHDHDSYEMLMQYGFSILKA